MKSHSEKTLPAWSYRDAPLYESERRLIFARSWLLAAHECQMQKTGDYVAVTAAGYPLILVRAGSGGIRAFHNVCRHRAGPLANEGTGHCEGKLVCRYHGWQYELDGRLSSVPDFGPAGDFDPRDFPLFPVKCETWRGFVFISMNDAPEPLSSFIAPLDAQAKALPLESFGLAKTTSHYLACNWKTYVENYLEAYHVPHIHPFLNSAIDTGACELDITPPGVFWRFAKRDTAPVSGLWAWLWPCLSVNVYVDGILMERVWPLSATTTRLDYLYLFPEDIDLAAIDRTIAASELTTSEDKAICEAVQRNLDAGIFDTGCLSPKHEQGVAWFQSELRRLLTNDFRRGL